MKSLFFVQIPTDHSFSSFLVFGLLFRHLRLIGEKSGLSFLLVLGHIQLFHFIEGGAD